MQTAHSEPKSEPGWTDACVLPALGQWRSEGLATALVSLIAIDGRAPRPLGAQMAVAADGRSAGYLSGGCLEANVIEEAQRLMAANTSRILRYGRGSPYFDLRLPCGSGLDLYFDCALKDEALQPALALIAARQSFALDTDLLGGATRLRQLDGQGPAGETTRVENNLLTRVYRPHPRVLLAGAGPVLPLLAQLLATAGIEVKAASPDDTVRAALTSAGLACAPLPSPDALDTDWIDPATAVVLAFHEHDWEAPLLQRILQRPAFYTGALGSHTAQAARCGRLQELGVPAHDVSRVHGPIGLIPGARSRMTLASGILAEITAAAKRQGLAD